MRLGWQLGAKCTEVVIVQGLWLPRKLKPWLLRQVTRRA